MALIYDDLFGHHDKVQTAIERIKMYEPISNGYNDKPYYVCYSGGKDSDVIRILYEMAGVKYDLVHNHTTMDAPETVYYVRSIPNIIIEYPDTNIHKLIVKKHYPPTRKIRYCCSTLKERGGTDRFCATGVRWSESSKRKNNRAEIEVQAKKIKDSIMLNSDNDDVRKTLEHCSRKSKWVLNPIIDWSDDDVWEFLHYNNCDSNPLYHCGFKRVGCVGCPLSAHQKSEFERYPKFKDIYIRDFDKMLQGDFYKNRETFWKNGEDVFDWWVNGKNTTEEINESQILFNDFKGE